MIINYSCGDKIFQLHMPDHHKSHEWRNGVPPSDAVTVHPRMFALFRGVVITGSVLIKISPFYYIKDGEFRVFAETTLNTTPYLATTANKVRLAVVGFNISTEAIEVYTGDEIVFSAVTPPPLPTGMPSTFFPSFLVRLRYNTTELFETDITDARFALQEMGGGSSITLAADADTILGLTDSVLGLDTQVANLIFAGPTTGAAADPAFRSLVDADIPASIARDTELDAHVNDAVDAHDATAISNTPAGSIAAITVQAAIDELDGDITTHLGDTTDAHDSSAISTVTTNFDVNLSAADDTVQKALETLDSIAANVGENLLYDSLTHECSWLEGTSFPDYVDDTYGPALWTMLHAGSFPDASGQAGGSSDPFTRYFRCTFDASSQQAGIVQFLEAEDAKALRSATVSLSADLWANAAMNMRMAVIEWTGTADALTSDVIATWNGGSPPTLAANWSFVGTPTTLAATSSRQRFVQNELNIGASINNLAVLIWSFDQQGSGDFFNVARVKLEVGLVATEFVPRLLRRELMAIYEFIEIQSNQYLLGAGGVNNGGAWQSTTYWKVSKRTTPTVTLSNITYSNASGLTVSSINNPSLTCVYYIVTTGSAQSDVTFDIKADARL